MPKVDVLEKQRVVRSNDPKFNAQFNYANNFIKTSKYTWFTFIPFNLFEQFQRIANTYFLILLVLQVIPQISSLTWITTVVPLALVLGLTAIKDAVDDYQRHSSDNLVNNRETYILREGGKTEKWCDVLVGDIIRVNNNEFVAADLLLLSTSEPNSLCYIETAELDGETNLKVRQALGETSMLTDSTFADFKCELMGEPPNNILSKYEGNLMIFGKDEKPPITVPLSNDQVLLRGCVLRNTKYCFGLVIFAGKDTKLMKNSGQTIFKRTRTDRLLNVLIIGIVCFLFTVCLVCVVASGIWETTVGFIFQEFLPWSTYIPGTSTGQTRGSKEAGATAIALLAFFSYLILFNTVVPISLYVSVEFLRVMQSLMINWDIKMYYAAKDTPAKARTTALNEELGQIEYIFSDKTGTLTQNMMTFNKCSINGRSYGTSCDIDGNPLPSAEKIDFSATNVWSDGKLEWYDKSLVHAIATGDKECIEFFKLLALCHTIMPENKNGKLVYQAQSPDEEALVGAARNFGFVFKMRTPNTITIIVQGIEETYKLLCILDFNNVRKRMSVILEKDNKIMLLCKGADTTVNARLHPSCKDLLTITCMHLNEYANIGLRTLTLASKELEPSVYHAWKEKHYQASIALTNRDDALHDVYEEIEVDMMLLGATAIEDKLQDGVPDAIANLANAGIKIWVLTGDKQETAINIGYSCKLLTEEMEEVFVVDGESFDQVQKQLSDAKKHMEEIIAAHIRSEALEINAAGMEGLTADSHIQKETKQLVSVTERGQGECSMPTDPGEEFGGFGIVINGHSLIEGLGEKLEMLLLETACLCKAVICCRVTPLQKAKVVELVKNHKQSITLAIGDGANDVSMIKTAHIGVGISGQEGMQAVLASDYSFAQFRYLERLLLVHGRWSYLRMCKFLAYFFYKNFAFTLAHFWYAWYIGFSAQTVYDPSFISIYNVVYTSLPVLALGVFEKDVEENYSLSYPKLYAPGLSDMLFNKKRFALSLLEGFLTSCALFYITYWSLNWEIRSDGLDMSELTVLGLQLATMLLVTVTLRCAIETHYWTPLNHLVIWGSIAAFFCIHFFLYADFMQNSYLGTERFLLATPNYWLTVFLGVVICLMPVLGFKFLRLTFKTTLSDKLRLRASIHRSKSRAKHTILRPKTSIRREFRTQSIRSGYAFAHEEGFGNLITSGRYLRRNNAETPTATTNVSK